MKYLPGGLIEIKFAASFRAGIPFNRVSASAANPIVITTNAPVIIEKTSRLRRDRDSGWRGFEVKDGLLL